MEQNARPIPKNYTGQHTTNDVKHLRMFVWMELHGLLLTSTAYTNADWMAVENYVWMSVGVELHLQETYQPKHYVHWLWVERWLGLGIHFAKMTHDWYVKVFSRAHLQRF
jgi:hypothetical protein